MQIKVAITGKQLIRCFDQAGEWERAEEGAGGVIFSRHHQGDYYLVNVPRYSRPLPEAMLESIAKRSGLNAVDFTQLVEQ